MDIIIIKYKRIFEILYNLYKILGINPASLTSVHLRVCLKKFAMVYCNPKKMWHIQLKPSGSPVAWGLRLLQLILRKSSTKSWGHLKGPFPSVDHLGVHDHLPLLSIYQSWHHQRVKAWQRKTRDRDSSQIIFPRKLQHTPISHTPGNPPSQLWKESLYSQLEKV